MAGHGEKRSRKQEAAIAALLTEPTIEAAAAKAGVGSRTLREWLQLPDFAAAYREAHRRLVERTVARLLAATDKAVDTLTQLMDSDHNASRARAALGVLDHASKGAELLDLDARLAALEARMAEGVGK